MRISHKWSDAFWFRFTMCRYSFFSCYFFSSSSSSSLLVSTIEIVFLIFYVGCPDSDHFRWPFGVNLMAMFLYAHSLRINSLISVVECGQMWSFVCGRVEIKRLSEHECELIILVAFCSMNHVCWPQNNRNNAIISGILNEKLTKSISTKDNV